MKLQNWYIINNDNGYTAPELIRQYACGNVYGHPTLPDGNPVRTSAIVEINLKRRYVKTESGNKYMLGRMGRSYAKFVRNLKKGTK